MFLCAHGFPVSRSCIALSRLVFDFMSGEEFREEEGVTQVIFIDNAIARFTSHIKHFCLARFHLNLHAVLTYIPVDDSVS